MSTGIFLARMHEEQTWQGMDTQSGRELPHSTTLREVPMRWQVRQS